eukprot:COSAG01_NODE_595_length_15066_cov_42.464154_6_plen_98_part_00
MHSTQNTILLLGAARVPGCPAPTGRDRAAVRRPRLRHGVRAGAARHGAHAAADGVAMHGHGRRPSHGRSIGGTISQAAGMQSWIRDSIDLKTQISVL